MEDIKVIFVRGEGWWNARVLFMKMTGVTTEMFTASMPPISFVGISSRCGEKRSKRRKVTSWWIHRHPEPHQTHVEPSRCLFLVWPNLPPSGRSTNIIYDSRHPPLQSQQLHHVYSPFSSKRPHYPKASAWKPCQHMIDFPEAIPSASSVYKSLWHVSLQSGCLLPKLYLYSLPTNKQAL